MEKRCSLCPRACNAVRGKEGFCKMPEQPVVARAALHFWEEPCISGEKGSGAVFFSGAVSSARTIRSARKVLESR